MLSRRAPPLSHPRGPRDARRRSHQPGPGQSPGASPRSGVSAAATRAAGGAAKARPHPPRAGAAAPGPAPELAAGPWRRCETPPPRQPPGAHAVPGAVPAAGGVPSPPLAAVGTQGPHAPAASSMGALRSRPSLHPSGSGGTAEQQPRSRGCPELLSAPARHPGPEPCKSHALGRAAGLRLRGSTGRQRDPAGPGRAQLVAVQRCGQTHSGPRTRHRALGKGDGGAGSRGVPCAKLLCAFPGRWCCPFPSELSPALLRVDVRLALFLSNASEWRLRGQTMTSPHPSSGAASLAPAGPGRCEQGKAKLWAVGWLRPATTPGCGSGQKSFAGPSEEGHK